jgi:hypothetical protein
MGAVQAHGGPLIYDPERIGATTAVGLDEMLFCRLTRFGTKCWSTQVADVDHGQLLDVVPDRDAVGPCVWSTQRGHHWLTEIH